MRCFFFFPLWLLRSGAWCRWGIGRVGKSSILVWVPPKQKQKQETEWRWFTWEVIPGGRIRRAGGAWEEEKFTWGGVFKVTDVGWTPEKYMECLLEFSPWKTGGWIIYMASWGLPGDSDALSLCSPCACPQANRAPLGLETQTRVRVGSWELSVTATAEVRGVPQASLPLCGNNKS